MKTFCTFCHISVIFVLLLDFAQVWSSDCDEEIDPLIVETKQNFIVCNTEFRRMEHEHKAMLGYLEIEHGQCTNMTEWSDCSVICGIGTRTRSKDCELFADQHSKKLTISESEECTTECYSTKLLVVGGVPDTERSGVIDFSSQQTHCSKVSDIPLKNLKHAVGGTIQDTPIICGGRIVEQYTKMDVSDCLILGNDGNWSISVSLKKARTSASAVTINDTLLITGGGFLGSDGKKMELLAETELITLEKSQNFVPLPEPLVFHCLIKVNETHVLSTGGFNEEVNVFNSSYLFDFNTMEWTSGPTLLEERMSHSCGSFQMGDSTVLLVAGGVKVENKAEIQIQSVEVLNTNEWNSGWQTAQMLPLPLSYTSIVPSPNNKGLILVGGINMVQDWFNINLLQFNCQDDTLDSCQWTADPSRTWVEARYGHVAMWIPEQIKTTQYEC